MFANTRFLDMLVIIQTIQHEKNPKNIQKSYNSSDTCTFRSIIYIKTIKYRTQKREYNCVFVFYKKVYNLRLYMHFFLQKFYLI